MRSIADLRIVARAAGDHPLQQLPRDHHQRRPARRASRRATRWPRWNRSRRRRCRRAMPSNGPAPPIRRQRRPARPAPILALAVLFAFLFLVALYESWMIPIPVLLSVTVGVLGAYRRHPDRRAVARSLRADRTGRADRAGGEERHPDRRVRQGAARGGLAILEAAVLGARMRFRAVMMTSIAFILGLVPLVWAHGAARSAGAPSAPRCSPA